MAVGRVVRADDGSPFKATGANSGGGMEFLVMSVGYASGPPLHVHQGQEDSFYVVRGVLTVQLGEDVVALQPGDFASAPAGLPHTFTNTDREQVAEVVNVMTPGIGFDRYLSAFGWGADPEEMERLGDEFGVTMLGPTLAAKLGLD
jgi:quercetin dioxygenase-like cupin family protein